MQHGPHSCLHELHTLTYSAEESVTYSIHKSRWNERDAGYSCSQGSDGLYEVPLICCIQETERGQHREESWKNYAAWNCMRCTREGMDGCINDDTVVQQDVEALRRKFEAESALLLDDYVCQKSDTLRELLEAVKTTRIMTPPNFTSCVQPCDVRINKSLKDRLKKLPATGGVHVMHHCYLANKFLHHNVRIYWNG